MCVIAVVCGGGDVCSYCDLLHTTVGTANVGKPGDGGGGGGGVSGGGGRDGCGRFTGEV